MQRENTLQHLRRKLEAIAEPLGGSAIDPYDLDRFLTRLPFRFYDFYLDSPPSVESVETLVRLGVPRWALVSRGVVGEVASLLAARRKRGLASVRQARLLRARGHPRPWSVRFEDVGAELYRLGEGWPLVGAD